MFVQKPINIFTIHFYLLLRASLPRPKGSVTTLGGSRGLGGKAAYAAMIYGFAV
jgi:hypothetical protein